MEPRAQWITYLFDHPVTTPEWHWALDAPLWSDICPAASSDTHVLQLIADTFEDAGALFVPYSDAQLNQGLWYLASSSEVFFALQDSQIPLDLRHRTIRSFVPLFEQVMAVRCSPHLSHLDEPGANPLNGVCYMWWDILPFYPDLERLEQMPLYAASLQVMEQILALPHDACRESALHGLGHWSYHLPQPEKIITRFLATTPGLRRELRSYAERAKAGEIL